MRLIKNLCKYCTKYCTTINVNNRYMFQNTMTTQVCCTCNTQECETKSNENNLQLRYLVDKHQKGYKYNNIIYVFLSFNTQYPFLANSKKA